MPITQKLDVIGKNWKPDLESAHQSCFKSSVKSRKQKLCTPVKYLYVISAICTSY